MVLFSFSRKVAAVNWNEPVSKALLEIKDKKLSAVAIVDDNGVLVRFL